MVKIVSSFNYQNRERRERRTAAGSWRNKAISLLKIWFVRDDWPFSKRVEEIFVKPSILFWDAPKVLFWI